MATRAMPLPLDPTKTNLGKASSASKPVLSLLTIWVLPEAVSGRKGLGTLLAELLTGLSQKAGCPAGPLGSVTAAAQATFERLYTCLVVKVGTDAIFN